MALELMQRPISIEYHMYLLLLPRTPARLKFKLGSGFSHAPKSKGQLQ